MNARPHAYIAEPVALPRDLASLTFKHDGAQQFRGAAAGDLPALRTALAHLPPDHAGVRIYGVDGLRPLVAPDSAVGAIAAAALGTTSWPVRAILFDKTAEMNWSLPWHQDRTICVRRRFEVDGFGPWTIKGGMQHVGPPVELLAGMATLRVHLDDVVADNAPLLIAPGSHVYGRIPLEAITDIVRRCGALACTAEAGDVWLYSTPILHASGVAAYPSRRRVLQLDFAAQSLPGGLEWLGI